MWPLPVAGGDDGVQWAEAPRVCAMAALREPEWGIPAPPAKFEVEAARRPDAVSIALA
jgi:hypothetical protein